MSPARGLRLAILALFCALGVLALTPTLAAAEGTGEITGTVTDATTGQPLAKIGVCARDSLGASSCTLSDPIFGSGEYVIASLTEGSYQVEFFSTSDRLYLTQFWNGKESESEADPVAVTEGAITEDIDAAMQEGGRIAGTVTAAFGGAPIEGIDACALEVGGPFESCGQTDADGRYTIPGLYAGSYKVEFSPGACFGCGSLAYLTQFYEAKEAEAEADPILVSLGATTEGIDVRMISSEKHTITVALAGSGSGTVTSSPAGISCGATCSHPFTLGSSIMLTAVPAAGSSFVGFSGGACSGTEACSLTVDHDLTITATFAAAENGGSGGGDKPPPRTQPPKSPPTPHTPSPPPRLKKPNTKITEAKLIAGGRATFSFRAFGEASGFQCALQRKGRRHTRHRHLRARPAPADTAGRRPHFRRCTSPRRYRHLKPGRYLFRVRAIGPGGSDPTPAARWFRVRDRTSPRTRGVGRRAG
jgi:hypothetical protein